MSRNNPASSRLKISNPTLISTTSQAAQSSLPNIDRNAAPLGIGQVWNGSQAAPGPSPSRSGNGEARSPPARSPPPHSPPLPTSPSRPARSRARGTPEDTLIPPVRAHASISTRLSVMSNGDDEAASPVVPLPRGESSDPWAADRAQRSVARQQTNETAQAAALRTPVSAGAAGGNALRNAAAAFMAASKQSRTETVRRPPRPKRTQPSKEDWDDIVGTTGGRFAEIDAVMRKIRTDWPFIMDGDFSPSSLALSLLASETGQGGTEHPDLQSFLRVHTALSGSLQKAVQSHFQTFAASLPTHSNFVATLDRAQEQVKTSREGLKEAREGIGAKGKAELASIRTRERMVKEMLQVLDLVEELKQVPEQLESCLTDKRFLQAALLLQRSIKTANREVLQEVGALSDLKQYFHTQENTLTDILVEELHNHLYLKAFNSDGRWKAYMPGQESLPVVSVNGEQIAKEMDEESPDSRFSTYLASLAVKPNHEPLLNEIASNSRQARTASQIANTTSITSISSLVANEPMGGEFDTFGYMEMILEALAAMGRLGSALDTVIQRVPVEIHQLIDVTTEEVAERAEQRSEEMAVMSAARPQSLLLAEKQDLESMPLFQNDTLRVVVSLDASGPPKHAVVLRDLFWTLYSKIAAVMEGHRTVYEVVKWIASRRDFKDMTKTDLNLNAPVLEVLRPIQQEVRHLLQTYLEDNSQASVLIHNAIPSINEILREGKLVRDKQRELFKFGDSDQRAVNNEIKDVDDGLKQTLRASVPGLINLQAGDNVAVLNGTHVNPDDRYSVSGKHRTLIPANPFNVTILFQPTLALIDRATAIVPHGFEEEMTQFGTVLEEFVNDVFLPQLDEKVNASFQHAVSGHDAFQLDRRPSLRSSADVKPPLKSTVRVMALIQALCAMLQETPFHRERYSRLIVGVVAQYYQQCSARFKDLVALPPSVQAAPGALALPATWSQREDMSTALQHVRTVALLDARETETVGLKEVNLEMALLSDQPPPESQLINSSRRLEALGNLAHSVRWFMNALLDLQELADEATIDKRTEREPGQTPRLPLTEAMAQRFKAIVQTYEQLIEGALNTLHLEVRCRVLCNLYASLQRSEYFLESEALEPDPDVVDLNTSLMEMDHIASKTLSASEHGFMFRGLALLIDHVFVHAARQVKRVNAAGARKLRRNILSLQQTLRGIVSLGHEQEGMLSHAIEYWDLFEKGPKRMLESIRTRKPAFSFEDYNAMLELQCRADSKNGGDDLNAYLIDLHALAMSVEGWDVA
ncbi:hypothetical protein CcaverHIS002_0107010 [Cutaneotrichosporon cavernicola]|uniref:Exocyst complex component Sec8 n=1 Tax=Cutaneotrichosporon cavernicola TaxID=279322 RepID=A0AA48II08_9TREE|nr:uncharacterized protein CcaverHIS019_0106960 [Cutaneotrichosporon cavernicola]BEI80172.1 hypothetical protein CcaverHIS002_0107010 [Cutaneotrichosporon cavernicola]BEI87978.1 hypothetical protein CcaverHIS019_0106960 [Cutaneotrichosporon cavernicola]BEI95753.1 hypothetical protein CcaverHIS631_0107020 [Cutaneotrichosporon cavernicola]